jgi:hypothetical protein
MKLQLFENTLECVKCRVDRKSIAKEVEYVFLCDEANDMNSEIVPSHLPSLIIVEKLCVIRAHVLMSYRRVRGCQYKYSRHVVNFMQNTIKIVNRLSSLSFELQMLILRSSSKSTRQSVMHRVYEFDDITSRFDCDI